MENRERLVILTTPSRGDGVRLHVERAVDTHGKKMDLLMKQLPHMETAIQTLQDGTGDLLAMSAFDWLEFDTSELSIAGLLTRKEPTWVLVADDKPEYLENESVVICDHELLRRQMKRMRQDVVLKTSHDLASEVGDSKMFESLEDGEQWSWLEEQRKKGVIDGFIAPRSVHSDYRFRGRRHTLGLQRDSSEQNRERFIPPPLHGFTLLVSRQGFLSTAVQEMLDPSAHLAYRLESAMMESLDDELRPITGIFVEQRKISTILKKARENEDEIVLNSLTDPDKPTKKALRPGPRVEMMIETLNPSGTVTAACERMVVIEDSHLGMVNLLREFIHLITIMTSDHEATKRKIPGMPDVFSDASPRLLDFDEN